MRIAVTGGTGTLGQYVVEELRWRGHEVRVLSRTSPDHPVDLTTGEGLGSALSGCDVVVDAANSTKAAAEVLVDGSGRLLAAEAAAGVGHHVCVSIVGCDRVPLGYFRVKAEQERVVAAGPVPWTTVRIAQFHELVASTFAASARWRVLPVPRARLRSVAAAEAARAVADVAEGAPRRGWVEVTGPEVADARQLAKAWKKTTGHRALLLPRVAAGPSGARFATWGTNDGAARHAGSYAVRSVAGALAGRGAPARRPRPAARRRRPAALPAHLRGAAAAGRRVSRGLRAGELESW